MPAWAAALERRLLTGTLRPTDHFWGTPPLVMTAAGYVPDPWQAEVLASTDPQLLLACTRQAGKSLVTAALAVKTAIVEAPSLILLLSPTLRQSGELFRDKVLPVFDKLNWPVAVRQRTALTLELANGSRIVSLPENEEGIRGFSSVSLLVIDEASRVSDALYRAVRPMLAVSRGRLVLLSSAFGKRGFFYEEWEKGGPSWRRFRVTAPMCPRISAEFLESERERMGERWWRQEYFVSFEDAIDAVFADEDIEAAMTDRVRPFFEAVP